MENAVAKTHKYLKKRHQAYVLRVPVPKSIQGIIGKREITRSLKTRDMREANYRYPEVLGSIQAEFALAEAQIENDTPVHLDDFDPVTIAKSWLGQQMQVLLENDIQQFAIEERGNRIEDLKYELAMWKCGEFKRYASNLQVIADAILIQIGYPRLINKRSSSQRLAILTNLANVDKSSLKYHRFVELVRKALIQLAETELRLLDVTLVGTPVIAYEIPQKVTHQSQSIKQLIDEYLGWQEKTQNIRDKKTVSGKKAAFKFLTQTVGEGFPIAKLARKHFLDIHDLVDKFPRNARKNKRTQAMSVAELVKLGIRTNMPIISITTKNKIMARLGSLMQYAEEVGYIDRNPCKRLRFGQSDADKAKREKSRFQKSNLLNCFNQKLFSPIIKAHGRYIGQLSWLCSMVSVWRKYFNSLAKMLSVMRKQGRCFSKYMMRAIID